MDVSKFMESDFVTKEMLEQSVSKKLVIVSSEERETKYGLRLALKVGIDGKEKTWTVSRKIVEQLTKHFGSDSDKWAGKVVSFTFVGKELALFPA